jgi:hypothetical protein
MGRGQQAVKDLIVMLILPLIGAYLLVLLSVSVIIPSVSQSGSMIVDRTGKGDRLIYRKPQQKRLAVKEYAV